MTAISRSNCSDRGLHTATFAATSDIREESLIVTRAIDYERYPQNEPMDEKQMASWIKQAAAMPGWIP